MPAARPVPIGGQDAYISQKTHLAGQGGQARRCHSIIVGYQYMHVFEFLSIKIVILASALAALFINNPLSVKFLPLLTDVYCENNK
jgi:hypothetical protein